MIKSNLIVILTLAILLFGCDKKDNEIINDSPVKYFPLDKPDLIGELEYELINQIFENLLMLQQTKTNLYDDYSIIKLMIPDFDSLVYVNYLENNDRGYFLDSVKLIDRNIKLISNDENDYFFNSGLNNGWDEFYKRYPNSKVLTSISRVGFNQDSTLAMICIGFYSPGSTVNAIRYYNKENKQWNLIGKLAIISD